MLSVFVFLNHLYNELFANLDCGFGHYSIPGACHNDQHRMGIQ